MKKILGYVSAILFGGLVAFFSLHAVWMNGFDTGADVDACVIAYYQEGLSALDKEPSCQRAKVAKDGVMWKLFARKGSE